METPALRCGQTLTKKITSLFCLSPYFAQGDNGFMYLKMCILVAASDPCLCVPLSWSSCTRWASAPERTVWGSSPGTSGTCSWPAATWSGGRGTRGPAPERGSDLKLARKDESEVADFYLHQWLTFQQRLCLALDAAQHNYGDRRVVQWIEK